MLVKVLTLGAAAVFTGAAPAATVHADPPPVQNAQTISVTCTGPVFGVRSDSVNTGEITDGDNPVRNLINNQSTTSFSVNCGNGVISGVMTTAGGFPAGGSGTSGGNCTGCA